ncbi:helix-turn-helix domain-containing protein [Spirulina sp. 06S082]|uniref:helix-turn-helix domain-containing protein n=1 Tax=Spirulina sp. 06S082 TaxID=3110248 RepID=UPI002B21B85C|nr:helix-turn-helix domain-containing protein [Spirulina sp. 06S082]MEA5471222.1 helix-turn-helix domain-containing protein [Spirulina sp. 06S082]
MTQWQPQQIERLKLIGVRLQFHRDKRPLDRLAARLQIDPAVLLALEAGRAELLPMPKQTRLLIQHYSQALGIEYLNLADSLPLIFSEAVPPRKQTQPIPSPAMMPRRGQRRKKRPAKRLEKILHLNNIWQRFLSPLSAVLATKNLPNLKNLGEKSKTLQLWLGIILFLGGCLGVIVAIVQIIFVLFSPTGRMMLPWGIFWLGIFEFLKVFISFVCFFSLLLWLGARGKSQGRSPNTPKFPPNDSRERNETPHDQ